jgi:hypothetical protein
MTSKRGIVVTNTLALYRSGIAAGMRESHPSVGGSAVEAITRYGGFDGILWPVPPPFRVSNGVADPGKWPEVDAYMQTLPQRSECRAVLIESPSAACTATVDGGWAFVGYDVGYVFDEQARYSVILNEIVLGQVLQLRRLSCQLNGRLLFESRSDAERVVIVHAELERAGVNVEDSSDLEAIRVFSRA